MKNPIFLVSTGRTGTKFFSSFFSTYAVDVASYHTTRYTRFLNILGNMYRQKLISRSIMKAFWKRIKLLEIQSHELRYIECNPYYYNIIDIITEFFPEAKFICVTRFPKTFVLSHIKWERQRWKSIIANRLVPYWQPTSYLDQLKGFKHDYYQRVEFYSKVWARKNTAILEAAVRNDNAMTLKFEEIFHHANGVDAMVGLIKWLDIKLKVPITKEMVAAKINTSKETHKDIWDDHCTKIMDSFCLSLLRDLGYE